MATEERVIKVEVLSRVEGEGRFHVKVKDGKVEEARLAIFEAPRFFEALLRGRSLVEVPDVVARICGICPVAYQMSAVRAIENALGSVPSSETRALRRLLYCGEWVESHALHVFMLHAPDFLGFPSAIEMASQHRERVEQGLRIKKAGNHIVEVLGGRAIHPVSPRVGGFTRSPTVAELRALKAHLEPILEEARDALVWTTTLPCPDFEVDPVMVALGSDDYPMEWGDEILVSGRDPVPVDRWESAFEEHHMAWSNALQCRLKDGSAYLCGPLARYWHHRERLHPVALAEAERLGVPPRIRNPYQSIVVRALEMVHALAEAIRLCGDYRGTEPAFVDLPNRAATGCGATEAPRGILWHRYDLDDDGLVRLARIVPPTSQNQARIEADLIELAPEILALPHEAAQLRCEQLIRAYDPCISCATHFLELEIERG